MPSIVFVRGGPYHTAAGAPLSWEISKQPGLDEEGPYVFYPGVPVEVSASDAAWLMNPNNTRERVFELVGKSRQGSGAPAPVPVPTPVPAPAPVPPADPVDATKAQEAQTAARLPENPAGRPGAAPGSTRP